MRSISSIFNYWSGISKKAN